MLHRAYKQFLTAAMGNGFLEINAIFTLVETTAVPNS